MAAANFSPQPANFSSAASSHSNPTAPLYAQSHQSAAAIAQVSIAQANTKQAANAPTTQAQANVKTAANMTQAMAKISVDHEIQARIKSFEFQWSENLKTLRKEGFAPELMAMSARLSGHESTHLVNTRECILQGVNHLDPKKSVVVVCGAQFYGKEIVEPLRELTAKCKRLILIDCDQTTLTALSSLLNSQKVETVQMDLTGGILKRFAAFQLEMDEQRPTENDVANGNVAGKLSALDVCKKITGFFNGVIETQKKHQIQIADIVGKAGGQVDYVISSLVASQLGRSVCYAAECWRRSSEKNWNEHNRHLKGFEKSYRPLTSAEAAVFHEIEQKLNQTVDKMMAALATGHIEDLFRWTAPAGRIYFADTVSVVDTQEVLIDDALLKSVACAAKTCKTEKWHWKRTQDLTFNVQAMLMQPKSG